MPNTAFPSFLVPMQPQRARPFHRDGWVYEEKVDGWRILAVKRGGVVRLWSRTGRDHARLPGGLPRASAHRGRADDTGSSYVRFLEALAALWRAIP